MPAEHKLPGPVHSSAPHTKLASELAPLPASATWPRPGKHNLFQDVVDAQHQEEEAEHLQFIAIIVA